MGILNKRQIIRESLNSYRQRYYRVVNIFEQLSRIDVENISFEDFEKIWPGQIDGVVCSHCDGLKDSVFQFFNNANGLIDTICPDCLEKAKKGFEENAKS